MYESSTIQKISIGQENACKLYCRQNQENSLVVIFPDENYSSDKPLLYYARRTALLGGHDVLCINYKRRLTWRDMGLYTIDLEADLITDALKRHLSKTYKGTYFVSKGIGTEVAGVVSNRLGYEKVKSIFLSPTNQTVKHIVNSKCTIIIGNDDEIFSGESIDKIKEYNNVELISFKDANRNLEVPDDMNATMQILIQVIDLYTVYFRK